MMATVNCSERSCTIIPPWNRVLLEKLIVAKLDKKFQPFYGTQMLITIITRTVTVPRPEPHESSPNPRNPFFKINFNIILPSTPMPSKWSLPSRLRPSPRPCATFRDMLDFCSEKLLALNLTPRWRTPSCRLSSIACSVGYPIRNYPYLEAFYYIPNLRTW
jgi:hypothetical protein